MSSQVKILSTELTILTASKRYLPRFSYGIISIITRVWKEKYIKEKKKALDQSITDHNINFQKENCLNINKNNNNNYYANDIENNIRNNMEIDIEVDFSERKKIATSLIPEKIFNLDEKYEFGYNNTNSLNENSRDSNSSVYFLGDHNFSPSSHGSSESFISSVPQQRCNTSKHHLRTGSEDDNTNIYLSVSQGASFDDQIEQKIKELEIYFAIFVTPSELNIICPTELVELIFGDLLTRETEVVTSMKNFIALQVDQFDTNLLVNFLRDENHIAMLLPSHFSDYLIIPIAAKAIVYSYLKMSKVDVYLDSTCYEELELPYNSLFSFQYSMNENKNLSREYALNEFMLKSEILRPLEPELSQDISDKTTLILTGEVLQSVPAYIKDGLELDIIKKLALSPEYLLLSLTNSTELSLMTESGLFENDSVNIWRKGRTYLTPVKVNNMVEKVYKNACTNLIGMSTINEIWVLLEL